jgi:hypothetical protein
MKYVKTFEELWPFRKESEEDLNKKNLISVCKYLLDFYKGQEIMESKLKRVEVGFSKSKENRFIIQFYMDNTDIVRFNWIVDSNFIVNSFESYYSIKEGKVNLHSIKQKVDKANLDDYRKLNGVVDVISKFFKDHKLMN